MLLLVDGFNSDFFEMLTLLWLIFLTGFLGGLLIALFVLSYYELIFLIPLNYRSIIYGCFFIGETGCDYNLFP